jgi:hypothetical protein
MILRIFAGLKKGGGSGFSLPNSYLSILTVDDIMAPFFYGIASPEGSQ